MNDCKNCKFIGEDSEEGFSYRWFICYNTGYDNLISFPFKSTKCKSFQKRDVPYQESFQMKMNKLQHDIVSKID